MEDIFESVFELKKTGKTLAIVIVIRTEGSTPRKLGTKMAICIDEQTIGP